MSTIGTTISCTLVMGRETYSVMVEDSTYQSGGYAFGVTTSDNANAFANLQVSDLVSPTPTTSPSAAPVMSKGEFCTVADGDLDDQKLALKGGTFTYGQVIEGETCVAVASASTTATNHLIVYQYKIDVAANHAAYVLSLIHI